MVRRAASFLVLRSRAFFPLSSASSAIGRQDRRATDAQGSRARSGIWRTGQVGGLQVLARWRGPSSCDCNHGSDAAGRCYQRDKVRKGRKEKRQQCLPKCDRPADVTKDKHTHCSLCSNAFDETDNSRRKMVCSLCDDAFLGLTGWVLSFSDKVHVVPARGLHLVRLHGQARVTGRDRSALSVSSLRGRRQEEGTRAAGRPESLVGGSGPRNRL